MISTILVATDGSEVAGVAERYGAETGSITQYFFPQRLSDLVFQIWGTLYVGSVLVILVRVYL